MRRVAAASPAKPPPMTTTCFMRSCARVELVPLGLGEVAERDAHLVAPPHRRLLAEDVEVARLDLLEERVIDVAHDLGDDQLRALVRRDRRPRAQLVRARARRLEL